MKFQSKINVKRLIVALCIMAVCIGTQQIQTVAWNTGIIEFSRDSIGFLMAVILMTNYKWSDFVKYKVPYIIWSILCIILGVVLIPRAFSERLDFLKADTIIISLGVLSMGYCVIHTVISLVIEKYRPKFYLPLFTIWVIMLVLMIFSRSDYLWPECYFVLFLTHYLTAQSSEQRLNEINGLLDGVVLAFIGIQAHSLLFRPYDVLRYCGNFCNPNQNCMFLCMCLAAILAKILFVTKEDRNKIVKVFYFLLAGACYSFICMTMSRSGYMTAFIATIFFLAAYCRIRGKMVFIRMGLLMVLLFVVLMPVTYLAVRYIPTIHPHVLFYYQEKYSTERVHSWDDRNSPKYISFEEMLQGMFGRLGAFFISTGEPGNVYKTNGGWDHLKIASVSSEPPTDAYGYVQGNTETEETDPDKIPVLEKEEDIFVVRYVIYRWYITHLSLRGMPYDEQGFQLTKTHWIQDTHDIYLDYGINFGYPVMILFIVFVWWGIGRLTRQGFKAKNVEKISCLLIMLIPPIFGLFEFSWGAGMISTVAFYLVFKEIFYTPDAIISDTGKGDMQ